MEAVGVVVGIVPIVFQLYCAVSEGYDLFIEYKEFPSSFRELQMALKIERQRLQLWGQRTLLIRDQDRQQQQQPPKVELVSQQDLCLWKLFEEILRKMASALEGGTQTMEEYGHLASAATAAGQQSTKKSSASLLDERADILREDKDSKDPPAPTNAEATFKHTVNSITRKFKFILIDKKKVRRLVDSLCYYNDSLDKMTSKLEQESSRRRLRAQLPTQDPEQLELLRQAAAILAHRDIETMASLRGIIEDGYALEYSRPPEKEDEAPASSEHRLEYSQLDFHGIPFTADQSRTIATFKNETVLVDWRCCRDGTWRRENPAAFQQRTENLAKILNGDDIRPLNLSVLHCVGYLNQNSTVIGYAFRLPPEANRHQKPFTLHHYLANVTKPSDIPDLGERFEIAKALVSTMFEFHNMGWMHKNIQSKNILLWPKPGAQNEPNLSKPYLVGFDVSRPNQSGEVSEKPFSNHEDDIYRHPQYKGPHSSSFQPPFDIYSLGIVLFEIGLWVTISSQDGKHPRRGAKPALGSRATSLADPAFIENVMKGPVMDLKRYMGTRYRDAVITCLNGTFDQVWERSKGEKRMQLFQEEVQNKLVDVIATCNA